MDFYSYHIFYFPFKWEIKGKENEILSEQVDLDNIPISSCSMWERVQIDDSQHSQLDTKEQEELFAERQYYFDFVHPVLYDMKNVENSIIHHYERKEPKESKVEYHIKVKEKIYVLRLDALNVNLYSTGVGIMSFYLKNEKESQKDENSIRDINQFGRRIMPPHCGEFSQGDRGMLADSIQIIGLCGGNELRYFDSFDYVKGAGSSLKRGFESVWQPAWFIKHLIEDLSSSMKVTPVIDDRMLVNCWYGNDELSNDIKLVDDKGNVPFASSDLWYKHVFVDDGNETTCQNENMKKELLEKSTYFRWQKYGTLYGVSRYSMVALTNMKARGFIDVHMRTIYSRMFELVILQRASMLRFSGEVTKVSALKGNDNKKLSERIASLYKEYIRFINQIYFRSVTTQDQGIEMYEMLLRQFDSASQIKDLDDEISELHQYVSLMIDQRRNEDGETLNIMAAIFLPATLLSGVFGMNPFGGNKEWISLGAQVLFITIVTITTSVFLCRKILKNRRK